MRLLAGSVVLTAALLAACDVCDEPDVHEGPVTLEDQEDADALDGVRCIFGDLHIGWEPKPDEESPLFPGPTDLEPLSELAAAEGDLSVFNIAEMTSLAKLSSLTFVGRRVLDPDGERVRAGSSSGATRRSTTSGCRRSWTSAAAWRSSTTPSSTPTRWTPSSPA